MALNANAGSSSNIRNLPRDLVTCGNGQSPVSIGGGQSSCIPLPSTKCTLSGRVYATLSPAGDCVYATPTATPSVTSSTTASPSRLDPGASRSSAPTTSTTASPDWRGCPPGSLPFGSACVNVTEAARPPYVQGSPGAGTDNVTWPSPQALPSTGVPCTSPLSCFFASPVAVGLLVGGLLVMALLMRWTKRTFCPKARICAGVYRVCCVRKAQVARGAEQKKKRRKSRRERKRRDASQVTATSSSSSSTMRASPEQVAQVSSMEPCTLQAWQSGLRVGAMGKGLQFVPRRAWQVQKPVEGEHTGAGVAFRAKDQAGQGHFVPSVVHVEVLPRVVSFDARMRSWRVNPLSAEVLTRNLMHAGMGGPGPAAHGREEYAPGEAGKGMGGAVQYFHEYGGDETRGAAEGAASARVESDDQDDYEEGTDEEEEEEEEEEEARRSSSMPPSTTQRGLRAPQFGATAPFQSNQRRDGKSVGRAKLQVPSTPIAGIVDRPQEVRGVHPVPVLLQGSRTGGKGSGSAPVGRHTLRHGRLASTIR